MQKTRLASFLDAALATFVCFIFLLTLSNKFIENIILKTLFASFFSSILFCLLLIRDKQKYARLRLSRENEQYQKNCILSLKLMKKSTQTAFFTTLFAKYKKLKNIESIGYSSFISNEIINSEQIHSIISKCENKKTDVYFIIAKRLSTEAMDLLSLYKKLTQKNIQVLDDTALFLLFCECDYYPDTSLLVTKEIKPTFKQKFKKFLSTLIIKDNYKKFFLSGLALAFLSLFVPFMGYYLTFSLLLLLLSLICIIFGKPKNIRT